MFGEHAAAKNDRGPRSAGPTLPYLSHEGDGQGLWTGFLACGSSYSPCLPKVAPFLDAKLSGMVRVSSPLTVAGPRRNFTGLPLVVEPP